MHTIDVIIPVYKPTDDFLKLLDGLKNQTMAVNRIILYNTEESIFQSFAKRCQLEEKYDNITVCHHTKLEFDHGMTRNLGVKESDADVFIMMTMDAIPADKYLVENLYRALMQREDIAVSYARQLPREDCFEIERFTRSFNYPEESVIKTAKDEAVYGIKTYFCSNVCAAYKRNIFEELGGFIQHTIFNEDMIFAGGAVKAGYGIAYAADARVIHSHNYTSRQQFHRNFDLGVSQAEHPEIFEGLKSESEGIRLVLKTQKHLFQIKKPCQIFRLYLSSAAKLLGYKFGKNYRRLPKWFVLKCTMNKEYFV